MLDGHEAHLGQHLEMVGDRGLADPDHWRARFLAQWPPGSPGHRSYLSRITNGTQLRLDQAARAGARLMAGR